METTILVKIGSNTREEIVFAEIEQVLEGVLGFNVVTVLGEAHLTDDGILEDFEDDAASEIETTEATLYPGVAKEIEIANEAAAEDWSEK